MSSDSDTVSKELRSSEYECINQEEIKEKSKPAIETVPMNIDTNTIWLNIRYKNKHKHNKTDCKWEKGIINNVKEDQAIDKSLINYNLIINNLNTHHNKETKLLRVNASRLSWIHRISKKAYRPVWSTGCSAERVISAREHVWVRFAQIKRDGVPILLTQSLTLKS